MSTAATDPSRAVVAELSRGQARQSAAAVVSGLGGQLAALGLLATSGWLITTSSLRPPVLTLSAAIAAVRVLALVRGAGRYGERLAGHDVALRGLARLRVWAFRHLEPLVPGGLGDAGAGDVLSRVVADVDATQDLLVRVAIPAATGLAAAAAAVAIAAAVLPVAAAVLAAGLVVTGVVVPAAARRAGRRPGTALAEHRGQVASIVVEATAGATDLVAFGATGTAMVKLARAESSLGAASRRTALVGGLADAAGSLSATTTLAGTVAAAAPAVAAGRISGAAAAVLGFVVLAAFDAVGPVPRALAQLHIALGAARRVGSLAAAEAPVPATRPAAAPPTGAALAPDAPPAPRTAPERSQPNAAAGCPASPVTYELRSLTVTRPGGRRPALDGVDLRIAGKRRVAVVGTSGAGKTTLVLAMLRFVAPTAGQALVNGVDVRELDPDAVRNTIAWAPQDPHIFGTTVAANLRVGDPDATDDEMRTMLGSLGLGPWLGRLPDGLQTVLGEHGASVSGGERHRLGVARALLAARPLVVLDEPTANLDLGTEELVRNRVLQATEDRGLLWVTHRISGLEPFDEILVLDGGRVAERGTARHLAGAGGAFSRLLADQELARAPHAPVPVGASLRGVDKAQDNAPWLAS